MHRICFYIGFFSLTFAYDNLALHKPTYQQYRYTGLNETLTNASNAVDGLKSDLEVWGGQCTISDNNRQTATWWVNLTSILSIHHITIYYRTGNVQWKGKVPPNGYPPRFLGFSLYISNTTDRSNDNLCYKDTNFTLSTIPSVFNTTCPVHGQYVIFYNERLPGVTYPDEYSTYAFSGLCEVEVFGCPTPGFYGYNCATPCPDPHCRYCHIETGNCQGCKPGYQGHRCELECPDGQYGDGCRKNCGYCANISECYHVNGTCLNGCQTGYKGSDCIQECDNGTYGLRCTRRCGYCKDLTQCLPTNGTCMTGCKAGYQGDLCLTRCPDGSFGPGCINKCNNTCRECNKVSGLCEFGCLPGWKGNYCHQQCPTGSYGNNCSMNCGRCLNGETCHHVNGSCLNGCETGYKLSLCIEECDNSYGPGCTETCGHCLDSLPCNHINGSCINGCESGFKGDKCKEECDVGYYGVGCLKECSSFCKTSRYCHHVSGYCKDGCKNGWQGHDCLEVSKAVNTGTDNQTGFYSVSGLFCVSLLLNGIFIAYIIILRKTISKRPKLYQPNKFNDTNVDVGQHDRDGSGDVNSRYQELGELGREFSPYDALR